MANLYTYIISEMKKKPNVSDSYREIEGKIELMLINIDRLRENPLFIDKIHGEQELQLDQTVELLTGIKSLFAAKVETPEISPEYAANAIDVT
tara:strand:- start:421 stop:699 length:279 start_codon:yes stop_codon:yes gene_type:complete